MEYKKVARGRRANVEIVTIRLLVSLICYGFQEQRVVCPYKGDHLVSPGSFQKHTERCRLKSLGIDPDVEVWVEGWCWRKMAYIIILRLQRSWKARGFVTRTQKEWLLL